jgi:hypothetical protein
MKNGPKLQRAQNIDPRSRCGVKGQKAVSGYLVFSPKRDENNQRW